MSDFERFTEKGGRYVTQKTASVTMNHHGGLNVPGSVREQVFDGADYIEYHADRERCLLALEPHQEGDAPGHAYTLGGGNGDGGSVQVEKVLAWMGKRPPDGHTMFELKHDDDSGLAYIDVSDLPEVEDDGE